jgi:hypothetical protein
VRDGGEHGALARHRTSCDRDRDERSARTATEICHGLH